MSAGGLAFALAGPNPLTRTARFRLELPAAEPLELTVYDLSGRRFATLARGVLGAGVHMLEWHPGDAPRVNDGVYFARLTTARTSTTLRLAVVE